MSLLTHIEKDDALPRQVWWWIIAQFSQVEGAIHAFRATEDTLRERAPMAPDVPGKLSRAGDATADVARAAKPPTARQLEVLGWCATGLSSQQIGRRLTLAPSTVNAHLKHVYRRLHTNGAEAAIRDVRRLGYLAALHETLGDDLSNGLN